MNKPALMVVAVIALALAGFVIYLQVTDTPCNTSSCQADRIIQQYEDDQ